MEYKKLLSKFTELYAWFFTSLIIACFAMVQTKQLDEYSEYAWERLLHDFGLYGFVKFIFIILLLCIVGGFYWVWRKLQNRYLPLTQLINFIWICACIGTGAFIGAIVLLVALS
jgi:hypothetical protein